MTDRGDGSITIAWDKPSTTTSKIIDYTITYVGSPNGVTVPGDTTRFTATGLDNNTKYVFFIKAQNEAGYSGVRQSPELQPLGTPPPPAAPAVADLESGPNQTDLRIAWQSVQPEGPGPTVYSVSYSNGATTAGVPGCQRITSLTCVHSGVPYDGLTYTYRVVAANITNKSVPSEGTAIQAVGRPAAWGAFQVAPTGSNQEAEVSYTVPDSRGSTSKVEILVAGLVVRTFPQQTGAASARIPTPGNEQPYAVQLRVCNEDAPAGLHAQRRAERADLRSPRGTRHSRSSPRSNGRSIQWTISGSSNGDPAVVAYQVRNKGGAPSAVQTFRPTGVGTFSFTTPAFPTTNYLQEQEIFVTVYDDAPGNRGEREGSGKATSGAPPTPSIAIARGDRCQDGNPDQPACAQPFETECTADSCAYVVLTVRFAEGAPQTGWTCDFDKFDFRRRPQRQRGLLPARCRPTTRPGERVSAAVHLLQHLQRSRLRRARFP